MDMDDEIQESLPYRARKALPSPSEDAVLQRQANSAGTNGVNLGTPVDLRPKMKQEVNTGDVFPGGIKPDVKKEDDEEEDDPIVGEFQVFMKPQMMDGRQFYVLQYPTRDKNKPYTASEGTCPLELRVKPKAGMVEVDVPMDVFANYDKGKGIKWGEALKKSEMAKGGGSHGLPGGFGIGGSAPTGRGRGRGEAEEAEHQDRLQNNYKQAVDDGHVLMKQTLGGQFLPKTANSPMYMVGTFISDQLHLTPVDQIIPLRPQFHHIDAQAEQERLIRTRDANAGRVVEARALHMSVKSTIDGEESNATSMADRVAAVQAEPWQRHAFIDSEDHAAWKVFNESMFVGGTMGQKTEDLIGKVPKLVSGVNDQEYLDMISAPRDKNRLAKISAAKASKKVKKEQMNGKGKERAIEVNEDSSSTMSNASSESEVEAEILEKAKGKAKA